ncbi:MAG: hypothetical protein H6606_08770 [Flavobacteriales bacterium]|nr:hypothetical protein [Flavobacteriales bacterium]
MNRGGILLFCSNLLFISLLLGGCKEEVVVVQEHFDTAHDQTFAEASYFSTFDLVGDLIISQGYIPGNTSAMLPSDVKLTVTDSILTDGNGWEFSVKFGSLGKDIPHGKLCPDGLYRSGRLKIRVQDPTNPIGNVINVHCNPQDSFFTGNGTVMGHLAGNIAITRLDTNLYEVVVHDAIVTTKGKEMLWSCERTLEIVEQNGNGMIGATYSVTGSSHGMNRSNEHFISNIEEPLVKTLQLGCSQYFRSGVFTIEESSNERFLRIDYDPFENAACDDYVLIHSNGKRNILRLR